MNKYLQNLFLKYPWLKTLANKYVLVSLFFVIWMVFLDNYSLLNHRELDKVINKLEDNKSYFQQEIKKDEKSIKKLQDINEIERFAREKYFMKRDSEDIYIIDIEEDRIKDSLLEANQ
ncbi:septum formation initiator [Flavobacterium croceum DSM 17960]|uniref:Septum formation initiator n=1 Tax=Flavobacterium croceum DSM 17960 TaxID=1121886 RepID=A0A2S4N8T0_9FLAO|nr:septum formation initiator family protein [Flavobacterium croceum]POS02106.1 septum formation initiator [Flavobacterium croceum DSM 17960]